MLVLSRKVGEEIVIGTDIRITVVAIKGGKVRIGINAPKEIVVDRTEVHENRHDFFKERLTPASRIFGKVGCIPDQILGEFPLLAPFPDITLPGILVSLPETCN